MIFKKIIPKSQFAKNVLVLMTGTGLAQAISIGLSPVLTRLYSPSDFGVLALYIAIVSVLGLFATGRYEMAIMLPKEDKEVGKIVSIIFCITTVVALVVFVCVYFFNEKIASALGNISIGPWLYLVPLSIIINSVYQVINYLLIRNTDFKQLAGNKVLYSGCNSGFQIGLGILRQEGIGLLISSILSYLIAIFVVFRNKFIYNTFRICNTKGISETLFRYKKFPMYDLPATTINLFSSQLPIFALSKYFGVKQAGLYAFTFRILSTPLNLLASSILDVFKQKATEDYQRDGNCRKIYLQTLKNLFLLSIIPFTILFFAGPFIFGFVFGEEWRGAGLYVQVLAPMFMLKFITSPLTYVFYIFEKQKFDLIGQILLFICIAIAIYLGLKTKNEATLLYFYTISYSVIYLLYLGVSYQVSKGIQTDEKVY